VGSWKTGWRIPREGATEAPGVIAFSPDGELVVVQPSARVLRLLVPTTGRELASFESPQEWYGFPACFTLDGSQLAVAGPNMVHLWDLRRVRAQLATLGLDWDARPYPPASTVVTEPLEVEIQFAEPYTPAGKFMCVDFGPEANRTFSETLHGGAPGKSLLAPLPRGEQTFAGVRFNIKEKLIHLSGTHLPQNPKAVEGIQVNRACSRLHVLHAAGWGETVDVGTPIGQYKLHYEDETEATIPVIYGEDLRDCLSDEHGIPLPHGKLAWLAKDGRIGLYLTTWENPHPDKTVVSIDYISTEQGQAAPFCVAITVEGPAVPTNEEP
jgi:hypothetical protein